MVEKQERKDHGERNPEGELLVNGHVREGIQHKKAGDRDRYGGCVIDVDCADEVALLPLEFQPAMKTMAVHGERSSIQGTYVTARALETKAGTEHRWNLICHASFLESQLVYKVPSPSPAFPRGSGIQNPHCISPFAKGETKRG
jgi:hypothetical protein